MQVRREIVKKNEQFRIIVDTIVNSGSWKLILTAKQTFVLLKTLLFVYFWISKIFRRSRGEEQLLRSAR